MRKGELLPSALSWDGPMESSEGEAARVKRRAGPGQASLVDGTASLELTGHPGVRPWPPPQGITGDPACGEQTPRDSWGPWLWAGHLMPENAPGGVALLSARPRELRCRGPPEAHPGTSGFHASEDGGKRGRCPF